MPGPEIPEGAILLCGLESVGASALRRLAGAGKGRALAELDEPALVAAGLDPATAERVRALLADPQARAQASREVAAGLGEGDRVLALDEVAALPGLSDLHDAPLLLAASASFSAALLRSPRVAVVGTRDPSDYGLDFARELARELARRGGCVVSGGAAGVDQAAHRGALDAQGATVAVLGAALAVERQRRIDGYAALFARAGVLSELLVPMPIARWMFPRRNRIVAALAEAVVVIEGRERSGALITAAWARRLGRPLLALPGRVGHAQACAPNALLAAGEARACRGVDDVLTAIEGGTPTDAAQLELWSTQPHLEASGMERSLLERLERAGRALHIDELAADLGAQPRDISAALLQLELAGRCRQRPGQRYELVAQGRGGASSKG